MIIDHVGSVLKWIRKHLQIIGCSCLIQVINCIVVFFQTTVPPPCDVMTFSLSADCHIALTVIFFIFTGRVWRNGVNFFMLASSEWAQRTPAKCSMSSQWCFIDSDSKKLSKRMRRMTEYWFSPSLLNRKPAWRPSMPSCSPVCIALLSLLLAPALGRKSPAVQCTIIDASENQCVLHECHRYCETVCLVNTDKEDSGYALMPACWPLLGHSLYHDSQRNGQKQQTRCAGLCCRIISD